MCSKNLRDFSFFYRVYFRVHILNILCPLLYFLYYHLLQFDSFTNHQQDLRNYGMHEFVILFTKLSSNIIVYGVLCEQKHVFTCVTSVHSISRKNDGFSVYSPKNALGAKFFFMFSLLVLVLACKSTHTRSGIQSTSW